MSIFFVCFFLLLPIAFLCGWWVAFSQNSKQNKDTNRHKNFSKHYFSGLNYLLNEQPDKAVDVFLKVIELDEDMIETHFTLGSLFRQRGELDRAIRIHRNLINRSQLTVQQRSLSVLELARDYIAVGMLDRAEELLLEVLNQEEHSEQSFSYLLQIYQQRKDWMRAIHIATRYQREANKNLSIMLGQFYCELAEEARGADDIKVVQMYLKRALMVNKNCARASIVAGDVEQSLGSYSAAINYYHKVEEQDLSYWNQIVRPLASCYHALGQANFWREYVRKKIIERSEFSKSLIYSDWDGNVFDAENIAALTAATVADPSVHGVYQLLKLNMETAPQIVKTELKKWTELLGKMIDKRPLYRCQKCGFTSSKLEWLCPSCKTWESVKPRFINSENVALV